MKKKGLALILSLSLCVSGVGAIKVFAEEGMNVDSESGIQEEQGFHGERDLTEEPITGVDENGNVQEISTSENMEEGTDGFFHARNSEEQIVNFNYNVSSGVTTNYTEVGTGEEGYTYGPYGADAAYLGTNNKKVKFMLAGVIGEVPENKVQIVNKEDTKSISHYMVSNGNLYHYVSTNINSTKYGSTLDHGPAPSYLKSGVKYYSYDGHYFYTEQNFANMLKDYNAKVRIHSVNANAPYYNYFQFLSFRSQSNYDGNTLNTMLNNRVSSSSKMRDTGNDFVNHQNTYGTNALLMVGIGANESAWGTSNIAKTKNNLFGLNAVDTSPGQSANYFSSVSQCIKEYSEKWLSKEYLNPKNWKCYGAFLGNKASGMNVKYASDPYWGEKAAAMAWSLDKANGNRDANKYTIGIKDTIAPNNVVNVRNESNTNCTTLYKTKKSANYAFIVLNSTPINKFYKIQSEPVLNSGRTAINSSSGEYDFEQMYAYISSDFVKIVNKGNGGNAGGGTNNTQNGWVTEGSKKYYYVNGKKVIGEYKIDNKWYCFKEGSGEMITGWHNLPGKRVYYQPTGEMAYGEQKIGGKWYCFREGNGAMITGWHDLPGKRVYYQPTGEMAYGEQKIGGKWYCFKEGSGAMITGWHDLPGKRVYYQPTGEMAYGEQKIGEKWYCFKEGSGAMITGWYDLPGKRVYYQPTGEMAYGEQKIGGKWYCFKEGSGAMITGWYDLPEKRVYYQPTGEMAYGEQKIGGKWYCFKEGSGAMITGWHDLPGKRVYYQPTGEMAYGEQKIGGSWYYFKEGTGEMMKNFSHNGHYHGEDGKRQ